MRDLVMVEQSQRFPYAGDGCRCRAFVNRDSPLRSVRVEHPSPVELGDGDRRRVGDAEVSDGDGHECSMLDGTAHGGLQRWGFAAAQSEPLPELAQGPTAALVLAVHFEDRCRTRLCRRRRQDERSVTGRLHHRDCSHHESASVQRPHCALKRHLQGGRADDPDHQRADEPAPCQAQQRPGRHHGADDKVNRHEGQQQRPPRPPQACGQPRPRNGEHRGDHGDPPRIVDELRHCRVESVGEVEVPSRRRDAAVADRERQNRDKPDRRVRAEQFPLAGNGEADQDDKWQRHDRDAVKQIHQIGLLGRQGANDFGDGLLEGGPLRAGDQRTRDHDREEQCREHNPQDVGSAAIQGLEQAARNGDLPPVNLHVQRSFGSTPVPHVLAVRPQLNRSLSHYCRRLLLADRHIGRVDLLAGDDRDQRGGLELRDYLPCQPLAVH